VPLFAALADMQARFEERDLIQLSDQDNSGAIDTGVIDAKLASADALIVSYIAARHRETGALAGNALLTDIACDYAFALLWRADPPEWVAQRRKDAIARLRDIASGTIKLDQGQEEAAPRPGQILVGGDPQRFGRDKLQGY
jgi:phage gp36-like protein